MIYASERKESFLSPPCWGLVDLKFAYPSCPTKLIHNPILAFCILYFASVDLVGIFGGLRFQ